MYVYKIKVILNVLLYVIGFYLKLNVLNVLNVKKVYWILIKIWIMSDYLH